jgi:hypothetical protein
MNTRSRRLFHQYRRGFVITLILTVTVSIAPSAFAASTDGTTGLTLANLEAQITASSTLQNLPSSLVVPLPNVPNDTASALSKGCLVNPFATTALGSRSGTCFFGDLKAKKTMVLFGDSNAWMWLPAFNQVGLSDGFRVELDARAECEVADLPMKSDLVDTAGSKGCTLFRDYVLKRIATTHPFVTILVDYEYYDRLTYESKPYQSSVYLAGLQKTVSTIKHDKSIPIMLSPPPAQLVDPVTCLALNASSIQKCGTPALCLNGTNAGLSICAFQQDNLNLTIANLVGLSKAVTKGGGTYVSLAQLFCTTTTCPPIVDNTVVFFDQAHVSDHYSLLADNALSQLLPKSAL